MDCGVVGMEIWLKLVSGIVFDDYDSACTTSIVIATFPRFAGDNRVDHVASRQHSRLFIIITQKFSELDAKVKCY